MRRRLAAATVLALGVGVLPALGTGVAPTAHASEQCNPATTQYVPTFPSNLQSLNAPAAWGLATGAGVTVAVVDSGVDTRNAHLAAATRPGTDLVPGLPDTTGTQDASGHGTAIAGEIAARPVQGSGLVGLAYAATILPVRVFYSDDDQSRQLGVGPRADRIAQGIRYAADNGAKIINVSMSTTTDDAGLHQAVQYALAKGSLVVASGGNRDTSDDKTDTPRYPGAYPEVLAVAATDTTGVVTDDSIHGSYIGLAAIGTDVLTSYYAAGDCQLATTSASTSFATAYVSAAAALLAQRYPTETPQQWRYRLEVTAARPQRDQRDDDSGWGIVQPYQALTFVADGSAAGPTDPVNTPPPSTSASAAALDLSAGPTAGNGPARAALWWSLGGGAVLVALALLSILRSGRPSRGRGSRHRPATG